MKRYLPLLLLLLAGFGCQKMMPQSKPLTEETNIGAPSLTYEKTLVPLLRNTYDLGTSSNTWRDAYVSGTIYLNNCEGSGCGISGGSINTSGTVDINVPVSTSTTSTEPFALRVNGGISNLQGRAGYPAILAETKGPTPETSLEGAAGVAIQGDYAYVGNSTRASLAVIDITHSASPTFMAETRGPVAGTSLASAARVAVAGRYAYVATGGGRNSVAIIDISNPKLPTFLSEFRSSNPATFTVTDLAVSGPYVYGVTGNNNKLVVVNVSDPRNPVFVSSTGGISDTVSLAGAIDIFIQGKYAYVISSGNTSLAIFDISDPANPIETGEISDGTRLAAAQGVAVQGRFAYVAAGNRAGFEVIDVSNPFAPTLVGETRGPVPGETFDGAFDIVVSGRYAYMAANSHSSISAIDISSSTNPVFVSNVIIPDSEFSGPTNLAISGRYLFAPVQARNSLMVFDVSSAEIVNADIGSAKIENLIVNGNASFANNILGLGGLSISQGFNLIGDIGWSAPSGTMAATNTLRSSNRMMFVASSSAGSNAFIFDTSSTMPDNRDFFSIRNNGKGIFTVDSDGAIMASMTPGTFNVGRFFVDSSGNLSASGSGKFGTSGFVVSSTKPAGGVESTAFVVASTSNAFVGVGTSTPAAQLHVTHYAGSNFPTLQVSANGQAGLTDAILFHNINANVESVLKIATVNNCAINGSRHAFEVVQSANTVGVGGTTVFQICSDSGLDGTVNVVAGSAASLGLVVQGAASQTNSLIIGEDSAENILFSVEANGAVLTSSTVQVRGSTTSTSIGPNYLAVATSTVMRQGVFNVDSAGNTTASGTLQSSGTAGGNANDYVCVDTKGLLSSKATACTGSSLRELKSNIRDLDVPTDVILSLQPRLYTRNATGKEEAGLIFQEVEPLIPLLVTYDENGKGYGVEYSQLPMYELKVLKEHEQRIAELEKMKGIKKDYVPYILILGGIGASLFIQLKKKYGTR